MPEAAFKHELQVILHVNPLPSYPEGEWSYYPPPNASVNQQRWHNTLDRDTWDVSEALAARMTDGDRVHSIVERYAQMRAKMRPTSLNLPWYERQMTAMHPERYANDSAIQTFDEMEYEDVLTELPDEFRLYVKGCVAFYAGKLDQAVSIWTELLQLAKDQRQHRSTWAAYMAARATLHSDPAQSLTFFKQLHELVADGFDDAIDLENESKTWEPEAVFLSGDPATAFQQYASLYESGSWLQRTAALNEMRDKSTQCIANPALRSKAAQDNVSCQIIAAALVSYAKGRYISCYDSKDLEAWIRTLEDSKLPHPAEGADRLAWAAYDRAQFALARRCLALCDPSWPYARWVEAKLDLHDGYTKDAINRLVKLAPDMPDDSWGHSNGESVNPRFDVWAEIGVLELGQASFADAATAFIRSGRWAEVAYMVERVLTTEEVEKLLAGSLRGRLPVEPLGSTNGGTNFPRGFVSCLLSRRFARDANWDKAKEYASALDSYPLLVQIEEVLASKPAAGMSEQANKSYLSNPWVRRDPRVSRGVIDRDLARSKCEVADMLFEHGRDIMETWLEPDWNAFAAHYGDMARVSQFRANQLSGVKGDNQSGDTTFVWSKLPQHVRVALWSTSEERRRLRRHTVVPEKQFNNRYKAANLMWQASLMLPDNDEELMDVLWRGGRFLKAWDPEAAEPFYHALVTRNRKMPYAQEADKLRWFPKAPPIPDSTGNEKR